MKTNHRNHAFPCATSRARNTSSTRFLTKLLAAFAVSLFAFALATSEIKANAETESQTTTTSENKKTQDLVIPQVTLCSSLQKLGSSVEVRGEKYQKIFNALKASDYKKAVEAISGREFDGSQDSAREDLLMVNYDWYQNKMSFPLFLKTTFKESEFATIKGDKALFIVRLPTSNNDLISAKYTTGYASNVWGEVARGELAKERWPNLSASAFGEEHPDGIGYVGDWNPKWGSFLIVVATRKECESFFETIDDYYTKQLEPLKKDWQRVALGEMTKEEVIQKCQKILDDAKATMWPKAL